MKKIKKKTKKTKPAPTTSTLPPLTWMDDEGMHLLAPWDTANTGSIRRNDEEIPGRHQEISDVGRDGEDVREGKGRGTSASVSSEVGVGAKESMA